MGGRLAPFHLVDPRLVHQPLPVTPGQRPFALAVLLDALLGDGPQFVDRRTPQPVGASGDNDGGLVGGFDDVVLGPVVLFAGFLGFFEGRLL